MSVDFCTALQAACTDNLKQKHCQMHLFWRVFFSTSLHRKHVMVYSMWSLN